MAKLILMRHGQSEWNKLNLFTGWVDVPLSAAGIQEAFVGGEKIKDIPIDVIFTSTLIRAIMTAMLALTLHTSGKVPVILHQADEKLQAWSRIFSPEALGESIATITAWELNERMYGELQGLNKAETMAKFGAEQVQVWRRSYDVAPPQGESLAMTAGRALPYFKSEIMPYLEGGKNVLVSAHGNSLRAIIMHLDNLSQQQVVNLELATGEPIIYNYENGSFARVEHA